MSLVGGCCCAAVRYETSERVFHQTICHCPTCRRACGAPRVAWFSVARGEYRVTAGTPAQYRSSPDVTRTFCGACGTQLTYAHSGSPDQIDVTTCSLDNPELLVPGDHTFTFYRLAWDHGDDGTPQYAHTRAEG